MKTCVTVEMKCQTGILAFSGLYDFPRELGWFHSTFIHDDEDLWIQNAQKVLSQMGSEDIVLGIGMWLCLHYSAISRWSLGDRLCTANKKIF